MSIVYSFFTYVFFVMLSLMKVLPALSPGFCMADRQRWGETLGSISQARPSSEAQGGKHASENKCLSEAERAHQSGGYPPVTNGDSNLI